MSVRVPRPMGMHTKPLRADVVEAVRDLGHWLRLGRDNLIERREAGRLGQETRLAALDRESNRIAQYQTDARKALETLLIGEG